MEELYRAGEVKAIGVCNFGEDRLVDLILNNEIVPAVNQVETNPFFQQVKAKKVMEEHGVQIESWGPFAEGNNDIFHNSLLKSIADKYDKTVAQVILRWHIQRGVVAIPKSVHTERIAENFDIWDFNLSQYDMDTIATLDVGHSEIIDHHTADTAKWLNGFKIHE